VLLCSHFERYVYAINEEAIELLNSRPSGGAMLPESLKLLHSGNAIDELAMAAWENRSEKLGRFIVTDRWLWQDGGAGHLDHTRLLTWMKAPKPKNLVRYYRYWGITDIFASITRSPIKKSQLWLGVQEFVDLRNSIAHGDIAAQATANDIRRYAASARVFCSRADRVLGRQIARIMAIERPW
jgi:hypothetical protein